MTAPDRLRRVWDAGGVALGAWIFTRLDPVAVEALSRQGYDYVCIDLQHGLMDVSDMLAMLQALALGDATPLVRVPANDAAIIGRVLDAGAIGVIVPMVNSGAEAARAVSACRYAPAGTRSFGPVRAGIANGPDYATQANSRIICVPMVETAQAVDAMADIASVPGVDAVYVGPSDLSLTLGLPPAADNAGAFDVALRQVVQLAGAHGIIAGVHATVELADKRAQGGFRMVTVATDLGLILTGFAGALKAARQAADAPRPAPGGYVT